MTIEVSCGPGIRHVNVDYNPTLEDSDAGFVFPEEPRCPKSRIEVPIPRDFIGVNRVTASPDRSRRGAAVFRFEVRSGARPADLWFSTNTRDEGCSLQDVAGEADEESPRVGLFSVLPDGTRLDLCREGKAHVAAEPPGAAALVMKEGVCTLTLLRGVAEPARARSGKFRVVASYRGLHKEWPCTDPTHLRSAPRAVRKISIAEFLADPRRMDGHPAVIGRCRTVEHWNTGDCYVFSEGRGKVSDREDGRCDDAKGLRERLARAIRKGYCDIPKAGRLPGPEPE
ncbi:MAG: hypothetical protein ABI592_11370 [Acidobacteriota bacterium]